jgi:hypothetical protein
MSCAQGHDVLFALHEDQDFDFVTSWLDGDTHFCPVQLKELVPETLNKQASIDELLAKLTRYTSSAEVVVAIKMNRVGRFDPFEIRVPSTVSIRGLWMYAAISDDQNKWALWGDFMRPSSVGKFEFDYPQPTV